VFEPFGLALRREIAAISVSRSSVLVAVNALELKRLRLPRREGTLGEPEFPDSPRRALG
jgi:Cu2+-exporting ATPase